MTGVSPSVSEPTLASLPCQGVTLRAAWTELQQTSIDPALARLDRSTLLDRMCQSQPVERRFKVHHWPSQGVVQVGWGVYKPEQKQPGARAVSAQEREDNQQRATRRAAGQIRRDLLTIAADRMLTLTYRENMTDRGRAVADLARFNRAMKTRFEHWASVSVLEWQARGSAHFHLGVAGFYPVEEVRSVWRSIVGDGNIDIAFRPDGRGNPFSKLATYMAKYLAKNLDHGRKPGEHRYFRCQVPEHPTETYYIPATCPLGIETAMSIEAVQTALQIEDLAHCTFWRSVSGIGGAGFVSAELNQPRHEPLFSGVGHA